MSDVTYADPEVAALVASSYVPVRVDTDERPDVFARYGMGGWPTTAVVLPDGHPMYYPDKEGKTRRAGGTFYSPELFRAYFGQLAGYYSANAEMVKKVSEGVDGAILARRNVDRGDVTDESLEAVIGMVLDAYKDRPVGPAPGDRHPDFEMVDLTFLYWFRKADYKVLDMGLGHLTDMARGGINDRVGGGFHRYGHDAMFIVPAFEKLPSLNAEAITAYVNAYELTVNGRFLLPVEGMLAHVLKHGIDPKTRAFIGGMAAGSSASDNGDYYTWTADEVRSLLTEEEFKIASAAWDIGPFGEMVDSAPKRNVIFLAEGPKVLAPHFEIEEKKAEQILDSALQKLRAAREARPAPPVDPTTYGDWSGMMASAFFLASRTLHRPDLARKALDALDVLMARCRDENGLIAHVCRPERSERGPQGFLSDQARVASALLDAHEQEGSAAYLAAARGLADRALQAFRETLSGGFSDRVSDPNALGLMAWPVRDLRENMAMVKVLLRLGHITGEAAYTIQARKALESWADEFAALREHAAPYAVASQMLRQPPLEILIVGDASDPALEKGRERALSLYHPWKVVRHAGAAEGAPLLRKRGLTPLSGAQVAFCVAAECGGPFPAAGPLRIHLEAFLNRGRAAPEGAGPTGGDAGKAGKRSGGE